MMRMKHKKYKDKIKIKKGNILENLTKKKCEMLKKKKKIIIFKDMEKTKDIRSIRMKIILIITIM